MPAPHDPTFRHRPVLLERVVELLGPVRDGTLVDLTVGGGGHLAALLDARPDLRALGLDRDPAAIEATTTALSRFGARVRLRHARSDELTDVLSDEGIDDVVAVLADLGVSSPQVDRADRGFSYRSELDGPLDMRMDPTVGPTAADLIDSADLDELVTLLVDLGEERFARRIATALIAARPIRTTRELARLVADAIPAPARRRGGNPSKRTFQALRIAVNDELGVLGRTLDQVIDVLRPHGRAIVIAYHSGEDRLVKARLRTAADGGCTCPAGLPCVCGALPVARLLKQGAWTPSAAEIADNPRAESARLRAIERLPAPTVDGAA